MKKLNRKGFTLIELLAVVTIMGILMIVGSQAVSRIIENTRRDTFATVSREYINAVRNAFLADNLVCRVNGKDVSASATPDGQTYYFVIDTSKQHTTSYGANFTAGPSGSEDLLESGGKSPFGNAEMVGYIKWVKGADNSNGATSTKYSAYLTDTSNHGMANELPEDNIKRTNIKTKGIQKAPTTPKETGAIYCQVS